MVTPAWELAHRAAGEAGVELRPLTRLDDAEAILAVMIATWGEHQLIPRELIQALAHSGNAPLGAHAGRELVGYVLGWAGVDAEGLHIHSHMLAAVPVHRHRGIGYALKLAQRAQALDQGIYMARWTFDPLIARNAYFNLHKLGAVADRFERHFYGDMTDTLNEGDRTDRLVARWDLRRDPGPRIAIPAAARTVLRREGDIGRPGPVGEPEGRAAFVEVPPEYGELREKDQTLALDWREASATAIERCLQGGMIAVGFERERSRYVFAADRTVT